MSCILFGRVVASRLTRTRACSHALNTEVLNDARLSKFVINLDEKNRAFLEYSIDQERKVINFQHTFVPDAAKGKGLGKILTKAAFQYAIEHNLKCAPHTFQLAIEMQLSVLAPFLMIVLVRSPFYGTAAYVLLHCLSTTMRFSATAEDRLTPYVYHGVRLTQLYRTFNLSTTETLHRITPYLAGFGLGYLMQDTETVPRARPERGVRWAGWFSAGVTLLWCWCHNAPLDIVRSEFQYEPGSAAQYAPNSAPKPFTAFI